MESKFSIQNEGSDWGRFFAFVLARISIHQEADGGKQSDNQTLKSSAFVQEVGQSMGQDGRKPDTQVE